MVVGFTTICAISAYHHWSCEFEPRSWWGVLIQHYVIEFVSDLQQVGGFLRVLRFPPPIKLLMFNIQLKTCTQKYYDLMVTWFEIVNIPLVHTFILFGNKLKIIIRSFKMKYICCISQLLLNITRCIKKPCNKLKGKTQIYKKITWYLQVKTIKLSNRESSD
jgi:hypothetical protein